MPGPVSQGALVERQQIVVPDAIGIGAEVWVMASRPDDADVRPLSGPGIDHEEGIALRVNALDHPLARPCPSRLRVTEVGYVFMGALGVRFCNTSHLDFGHNGSLQKRARNCAQFSMRALDRYADKRAKSFFRQNV